MCIKKSIRNIKVSLSPVSHNSLHSQPWRCSVPEQEEHRSSQALELLTLPPENAWSGSGDCSHHGCLTKEAMFDAKTMENSITLGIETRSHVLFFPDFCRFFMHSTTVPWCFCVPFACSHCVSVGFLYVICPPYTLQIQDAD